MEELAQAEPCKLRQTSKKPSVYSDFTKLPLESQAKYLPVKGKLAQAEPCEFRRLGKKPRRLLRIIAHLIYVCKTNIHSDYGF